MKFTQKFKGVSGVSSEMKFAVTGGAGFIGNHITQYLVEQNHSVIVIDNLNKGKMKNLKDVENKIDFHKLDILNYNGLKKIVDGVDGVFHHAALTSLPESFDKKDEYFKVNVIGTENIFKLAKECKFKVVFASSSSVYGNVEKIPITEDFEKKPLSPYAETKVQDEDLAIKYNELSVPIIGLRYFNVFGKGQTGSYAGVITKFIQRILEKKPPTINGDGLQLRDFVYVEDVAKANLKAMESEVNKGFFNVGSGRVISILDLANMFIHASGLELKPIFEKPQKGDARMSQADITLIKNMLNWEPETNLEDWIKKIIS